MLLFCKTCGMGMGLAHRARSIFIVTPTASPEIGPPGQYPEGTKKDRDEAKDARERAKQEQAASIRERNALLDQIEASMDETGETKDYLEDFQKSPRFNTMVHFLWEFNKSGGGGSDRRYDFEKWTSTAYRNDVTLIFQTDFAPRGKGRPKFVEGLKNTEPTSEAYKESQKVLSGIVLLLRKEFEKRKEAEKAMSSEKDRTLPGGAVGEKIEGGMKELLKNFERGSGTQKCLILGSSAVILYLIWTNRNAKLFETDYTAWDATKFAGGVFAVNYLVGKVTDKTLVQRLGWTLNAKDLKSKMLQGYALSHGMGENQEQLRSFIELSGTRLRTLNTLYKRASGARGAKKINPHELGFYRGEIDGEAIYSIMDALVKDTAVNEAVAIRKAEARRDKKPYTDSQEKNDRASFREEFEKHPDKAQAFFDNKYLRRLGKTDPTLLTAIINEYSTADVEADVAAFDNNLENFPLANLYSTVKDKTTELYRKAEPHVKESWEYVKGKGKDAMGWTRREVFEPAGRNLQYFWATYKPKMAALVEAETGWKKRDAQIQDTIVKSFLPGKLAPHVDEPDTVIVMGLPLKLETRHRSDGKNSAFIGSYEFVIEDGEAGNTKKTAELEAFADKKVKELAAEKAKTLPAIQGKNVAWDGKKWLIKDLQLKGDARLPFVPAKQEDISFTVSSDGKTLRFFTRGQEISDFGALHETYRDGLIIEKITGDGRFGKHFKGLPVKITTVSSSTTYGGLIEGTIAGLKFRAVPSRSVANSLDFLDASGPGGAEKLKIAQAEGGQEFLDTKAAQILKEDRFDNAFKMLEVQMNNVSEGVLDRYRTIFPDRWYGIPTSLPMPQGVFGKVVQRQWKFALDWKKFELLEFFKDGLKDKTPNDIDAAYAKHIKRALDHEEALSKDIMNEPSDEKRAEKFVEFLSGERTGNKPGIEKILYENNDYRTLFDQYKTMIHKFEYAGLDSLKDASISLGGETLGPGGEALDIEQALLMIWSYNTRKFSIEDPYPDPRVGSSFQTLSSTSREKIQKGVIESVERVLTRYKQNGVIHLDRIPEFKGQAAYSNWADAKYLTSTDLPAW